MRAGMPAWRIEKTFYEWCDFNCQRCKNIVQAHLDRLGEPKDNRLSEEAKQQKFAQIEAELKKRDAVLVAHYYCDPDVQELAEKQVDAFLTL